MATPKQAPATEALRSSKSIPAPPFSVQLLTDSGDACDGHASSFDPLRSLLPASYRVDGGDVIAARQDATACIDKELDLHRLNDIHHHLWLAGLPLPPRPLHHQVLLGREIIITERMDMHLVWTTGRMFLKPVPRFLLEPAFWSEYLSGEDRCHGCILSSVDACPDLTLPQREQQMTIRRRALGFLYSYTALISHESDFRIAQEKHLLPLEVRWASWRTLVEQLLEVEHIHLQIGRRFIHGELRLSRLNKIYSLTKTPLRGYVPSWDRYNTFFQYHFAWLASVTAYIGIVLTAMQVGLATEALAHNGAFQSASYGFTVFSMLAPLITGLMILLYFCYMFVFNCVKSARRYRERLSKLESSPG